MIDQLTLQRVAEVLGESIELLPGPEIRIRDARGVRHGMEALISTAAIGPEPDRWIAQWMIRECALALGVIPASIHDLYAARGKGQMRDDFTVPAMNLRALAYDAARAVFRAAHSRKVGAMIFEIARSEMGYTDQSPTEYASAILAAALVEGYKGPVFIQGDHFQVSASRYKQDPETELQAVRDVSRAAMRAGFYNIDIDTSTLVDLEKETIPEQQAVNSRLSAELSAYIREHEPEGITVSLGGEIGEVGGTNSTEPELRAYMDGFNARLEELAPASTGLSKISIQTGTSHGGVVLPDGSIAQVSVDFDTLSHLSQVAKDYGMGGAVQHGASTLPEEAFSHFPEAGALEVHLATNFQNILFDILPDAMRDEIYTYLDEHHSDERKADQTDEQFYYKTRKRAVGAFKKKLWTLPSEVRSAIGRAWENQFGFLFEQLNVGNTDKDIAETITPLVIHEPLASFLGDTFAEEDTRDLAD